MSTKVQFWFEFASTYSYLSAMRAEDVANEQGITLDWRPFLLGVIFKQDLGYADSPFNKHPKKRDYMWADIDRQSQLRGLPALTIPEQFPQNGLLAARISCALYQDERLPVFVRSVFRAQFQYGEDISNPEIMFDILTQNGFDAPSIMEKANKKKAKKRLRDHTEQADHMGIFGAPNFVTSDGELFWGDDRMESAFAWAKRLNN